MGSPDAKPAAHAAHATHAEAAPVLHASPLEPGFEARHPQLGVLRLRPLRLPDDVAVVHRWVSQDYAAYWQMVGFSPERVAAGYAEIMRRADVFLGYCGDAPAFLVETYDPAGDPIGQHYAVQPGDRGMHVLVAPPEQAERPIPGFTWAVFSTVMDYLFSDPATARVVVEPDLRNRKIHALNRRAGFRYQRMVTLPHKTAHLAWCTRADYAAARAAEATGPRAALEPVPVALGDEIAHLRPDVWAAVTTALVKKAIAELSHELLLAPRAERPDGAGRYTLAAGPGVEYRFRARVLALDHWDLEAASLEKHRDGARVPLDALDFFLELRDQLGISPAMLPVYLEEITSTLYAAAYKHAREVPSSAALVHAGFQELEAAMIEGHPTFIANSGRVGFDAADYLAYAPEAAAPVRLVWVAAHRRHAEFTCTSELSYARLLEEELGREALEGFDAELRRQGLAPADYLLMPVHPWQWFDKLATVFAPELASRDLVCLGYGEDRYRAQQSIRTFFNHSHPHRRYVKTAMSVLNMGFMRGLSADYMRSTPPINEWIDGVIRSDPYFARVGFSILREVAGVGYRNPYFEAAAEKGSPFRKMLAALWRESPVPLIAPNQRLMTMAALLHRDREGHALLPQLIAASGLEPGAWLARYLRCYLAPLVHCLVRYDLAFMPHGENLILVLEDHVPVRAFLKDIAEEAVIMDPARAPSLPETARRLCVSVPEHLKSLSIFTDVFDCILRYVAPILREQSGYPEEQFWRCVADCIHEYRAEHPELAEALARYDLFAPEFLRSCLNRLQLTNNRQMIDLADPSKNLQFAGVLKNPIAAYREIATPAETRDP